MEIKMYDVNWGEAILYNDGAGKLLVDCGSKFGSRGDMAYNAVKSDFSFGEDSLLITHFDEDHYNGVISMADDGKKLNEVFLPKYLFLKEDGSLHYTDSYFASVILFHLLGKKSKLNSLNRLIVSLLKTANQIKSVAKGDSIDFGSTKLNVIWPEEEAFSPFVSIAEELRSICVDLLGNSPNNIERLDGYVNRYIYAYVGFYQAIDSDGNIHYEEVLFALNDAHEGLLRYEDEEGFVINDEISRVVDSKLSNFIKSQNDCSVVFCKDKKMLALGDVSNKVVKRLKKEQRIEDSYEYIKASHHGTAAYYSPILPKSDNIFISNNGEARKNWKISEDYAKRYSNKCYCTNTYRDRCEWLMNGNPYCKDCNLKSGAPGNPRCLTITLEDS